MNGYRTDFLADIAFGLLFAVAIGLMALVEIRTGITFGLGVFLAYAIHVGWKMSRLDPQWMTREVVEAVEESVTEKVTDEVTDTVEKQVGEAVAESVDKEVGETVAKSVEQEVSKTVSDAVEETVTEEVGEVAEKVKQVNDRVERRPRKDEIEETLDETKGELEEAIDETKEKLETIDEPGETPESDSQATKKE